ncbi:chromosome partitioning protein ParA [Microbacterium oxydans]|nr:chromosome partitioning protein ParA [Microbacterium oxydans]MCB8043729.1 chromosome partitioning protein ParA [Microbacterium oxydans]
MTSEAANFPRIEALTHEDGTGALIVQGRRHEVTTPDVDQTRAQLMQLAADQARALGRPVKVTTGGVEPTYHLIVDEHAQVSEDTSPPVATTTRGAARAAAAQEVITDVPAATEAPVAEAASAPPTGLFPATPTPGLVGVATTPEEPVTLPGLWQSRPAPEVPTVEPATGAAAWTTESAPRRRTLRETSFLTTDRVKPADKGARGLLRYVGINMQPSAAELAERADIEAVSQHWPGPRTIKVGNRKGGSNKTPTTAALAAVFARYGGGPVLAWDNNENQGTLGWRTEQGRHKSSVLDLLRDEERLLSATATQGIIAGYVHHQTEDKYDVLRSDENNEGDHEIQANDVHRAHAIAERYYRLIFMDSGNTLRAANWRAAAEHTNQLVVPTTTMEDRAEAAKLTLQTLEARDEHSAQLAANAVVIISQWKPEDRAEAQRIAELFTPLVRAVVTVPYDPALKAGRIRYTALKPATQRAWLAAAAAVARGL